MPRLNRSAVIAIVVIALGAAFYWMLAAVRQDSVIAIPVHRISPEGVGEAVGRIVAEQAGSEISLKPEISGLEPGRHAFHVHENPSCEAGEKDGRTVAGLAAGGHFDPEGVMQGHGHDDHTDHDHSGMGKPAGDLPELVVDADGVARQPVPLRTLTMQQLRGRSVMIHAHAENSDDPDLPQGGGARIACGVVPG